MGRLCTVAAMPDTSFAAAFRPWHPLVAPPHRPLRLRCRRMSHSGRERCEYLRWEVGAGIERLLEIEAVVPNESLWVGVSEDLFGLPLSSSGEPGVACSCDAARGAAAGRARQFPRCEQPRRRVGDPPGCIVDLDSVVSEVAAQLVGFGAAAHDGDHVEIRRSELRAVRLVEAVRGVGAVDDVRELVDHDRQGHPHSVIVRGQDDFGGACLSAGDPAFGCGAFGCHWMIVEPCAGVGIGVSQFGGRGQRLQPDLCLSDIGEAFMSGGRIRMEPLLCVVESVCLIVGLPQPGAQRLVGDSLTVIARQVGGLHHHDDSDARVKAVSALRASRRCARRRGGFRCLPGGRDGAHNRTSPRQRPTITPVPYASIGHDSG